MKTNNAMIIITDRNACVNYYDTWEAAQYCFIEFIYDIKNFGAKQVQKVYLTKDEEIRITWEKEMSNKK